MPASTDMQPEPVIKKKGYHHGDLRRAIIVEAMRRARSHGERAIVLREIAAEIGVSATAAYRHFTNRQQLVEDVAVRGYEAMADAMAVEPVSGADEDPALAAYLDLRNACFAMLDFAARERPWSRMMLENLGTSEVVGEAARGAREVFARILARGVEAGVFRSDASVEDDKMFWAGMDGLSTLVIFQVYPGEDISSVLGDAAGRMVDLCVGEMCTDAGREKAAALSLPSHVLGSVSEARSA